MTTSQLPRLPRRALLALGLLLLAALPALPARAQAQSDGSIYSRFGIGELRTFPSSEIEGMGGAGLALRTFNYTNFENPAAWSDQILTRAAIGFAYQGLTATDAADNTSRLTAGSLNAIQFSFPILSRRLGAAFAFQPYARTNYRVQEEGFLGGDPTLPDSVRYLVDHEGRGGLQQIVAGLGYRLHPAVSVGANVGFVFGILQDARRTSFPGESLIETDLVSATRLSGVTGRVGVLVSPTSVLRERDMLSFAATVTLPLTLDGTRVRTLGESLDIDTLGTPSRGSVKLPLSAGLGIAYRPDERWVFAADGLYQPWTDFSSTLALPGAEGSAEPFTDRVRAGAGLEFLPAGSDLLAPFFERIAYRLGAYYDKAYVSPVAGVDLHTVAVTGGLSVPTLLPGTYLDLNLELGTRGTTDSGLVQDRFYRLSATLNIGERWFQKQRLR
jgi:hypothetical protein